ncbi:MAG: circularly permuted type 2 ATP-grasp protein [Ancalomicrobiaceae bacterium]|nr:circularly permuted type 2 ATP-grasp protein [Ancalomicrobiaceae bacterium]
MTPTDQLEFEMRFGGRVRPDLAPLIAGYRPHPGVYDELIDASGGMRSHWEPLIGQLAGYGTEATARIFEAADRHLRDAGVVYRVYDGPGGAERPWPLSHLPLVMPLAEWQILADGIVQRARLHEALLADLYGEARTVKEGLVPAALVAGNREYLRPLIGVSPTGGAYLHLYAADVSRAPDGRWWVLNDRTQAPSGLGYAIENRIALSRAVPELFRSLNVDRLAAFYQRFRASLANLAGRPDPRIAVLSPGPLNETYFEHAYLARSMGFLLVEGGDLTVHRDAVYVRTVDGAQRVDAIIRRIDADFADPLELNTASRLGVPGLIEAIRAGTIILANALGSGVAEAPALGAYLPALARRLIGEDLQLSNLATWWCGDPAVRADVIAHLNERAVLPAFGRTLSNGQMEHSGIVGAGLTSPERIRLIGMLQTRGLDFIGQEPVRLATTPVWERGRLVPRHYALRVFAARASDGWHVMPGGLCRISERADARQLSMQRGGRSADVWVTCDRPPDWSILVPAPEDVEVSRETSALPSRAADNLFWLGRYLERADALLRLVRGLVGWGSESGPSDDEETPSERLSGILASWGAIPFATTEPRVAAAEALRSEFVGALPSVLGQALRTASAVRDRLSPDAWRALGELSASFPPHRQGAERDDLAGAADRSAPEMSDRIEAALRTISALAGLAHENMNRAGGWRFLDLGTRVERAIVVARFSRRMAQPSSDPSLAISSLDRLLDLTDAQTAYRARYLSGPALKPVLDLVLLDASHPRSVAFQVERIVAHLDKLGGRGLQTQPDVAQTRAYRLCERLRRIEVSSLGEEAIVETEAALMVISDAITERYLAGPPPAED